MALRELLFGADTDQKTEDRKERFKRVVLITALVLLGVMLFTGIYAAIQDVFLQHKDLDRNLTSGLFLAFLVIALLIITIPVIVRLHWEDVETDKFSADDWATRMRALIAVTMTIVLLIFVLTWFVAPDRLEIQVTSATGSGANATQNTTVQLHPFVNVFVTAFMVVVAFYFPTAAAQSIAKTKSPDGGNGSAAQAGTRSKKG